MAEYADEALDVVGRLDPVGHGPVRAADERALEAHAVAVLRR
jgi:hypothetical protein